MWGPDHKSTPGLFGTLVLALAVLIAPVTEISASEAPPPERVVWQKRPIPVPLRVGVERIIHLPDTVRVGIPSRLEGSLRIQNIGATLYVLAHSPFPAMRVLVQSLEEGTTYVLDFSATTAERSLGPIEIHRPPVPAAAEPRATEPVSYGYVALTRFAAQQFYAPARLARSLPGVIRVPVAGDAVPLIRGAKVETRPLIAWRAGGLYVTAVQVRNQIASPVVLDPRTLRGEWLTATFQHNRLHPKGSEADTTVLYLVSERPFAVAL
ncbi:TIGR03749 family integrating conjugative element protein [Lentisalinibacter orientalis]|uniref:TIGR03749 family integrating conjugative element protein n=1 Tax=Lentisalinibacter orientalis TaxID=2992241 RepID=UPI003867BD27